jgi:hypothetical protein
MKNTKSKLRLVYSKSDDVCELKNCFQCGIVDSAINRVYDYYDSETADSTILLCESCLDKTFEDKYTS